MYGVRRSVNYGALSTNDPYLTSMWHISAQTLEHSRSFLFTCCFMYLRAVLVHCCRSVDLYLSLCVCCDLDIVATQSIAACKLLRQQERLLLLAFLQDFNLYTKSQF